MAGLILGPQWSIIEDKHRRAWRQTSQLACRSALCWMIPEESSALFLAFFPLLGGSVTWLPTEKSIFHLLKKKREEENIPGGRLMAVYLTASGPCPAERRHQTALDSGGCRHIWSNHTLNDWQTARTTGSRTSDSVISCSLTRSKDLKHAFLKKKQQVLQCYE